MNSMSGECYQAYGVDQGDHDGLPIPKKTRPLQVELPWLYNSLHYNNQAEKMAYMAPASSDRFGRTSSGGFNSSVSSEPPRYIMSVKVLSPPGHSNSGDKTQKQPDFC